MSAGFGGQVPPCPPPASYGPEQRDQLPGLGNFEQRPVFVVNVGVLE